ncbi:hypothetical protein [Hymenobacter cheonanensis]|uniref:hypothetical protein n=1 Tax=Hymenobacter sp. CA2-7 TaxID=3063993 RepID=UPI002712E797|nr:hypothetical protein [Hymenobacter sp. CA2-7]MDO7887123.1 hypothetical protein [Hymenobacter sp. CA2-7]
MTTSELLQEITASRDCGNVYLTIYEKSIDFEWESSVLEHLQTTCIPADNFKASLTRIGTSKLARDILTELLHHDLAYGTEIIPRGKASSLAGAFISLFSEQAVYFSNSTWNKNEYCEATKYFELGQTSWTSFTEATFDSGLIVCDTDKIGIAWFADED